LEIVGINGDGNWLNGNGGGELVNISGSNIGVRSHMEISSFGFTFSVNGFV